MLILVVSSGFSIYKSLVSPIYLDFFLSILKAVFVVVVVVVFFFFFNDNNNSFSLPDCSGYRTASIILNQSVE